MRHPRQKLTKSEQKALNALSVLVKKNPAPTQRDLAAAMKITPGWANVLWNMLEAKGAIAVKVEICA